MQHNRRVVVPWAVITAHTLPWYGLRLQQCFASPSWRLPCRRRLRKQQELTQAVQGDQRGRCLAHLWQSWLACCVQFDTEVERLRASACYSISISQGSKKPSPRASLQDSSHVPITQEYVMPERPRMLSLQAYRNPFRLAHSPYHSSPARTPNGSPGRNSPTQLSPESLANFESNVSCRRLYQEWEVGEKMPPLPSVGLARRQEAAITIQVCHSTTYKRMLH
jgi:hypothetical protein